MDIAGISIAMSRMNVGSQVGLAVTKLSMDTTKQSGEMMVDMLKSMEISINPNVGVHIDIKL